MPSFYMKEAKPVSPFDTPRPISVLIRFTGDMGFHDAIRQRLLTFWRASLPAALCLCPSMRLRSMQLHAAMALSARWMLIGLLWLQLYPLPAYSLAVSPLPTTLVEMTQVNTLQCTNVRYLAQWDGPIAQLSRALPHMQRRG